MIYVARFFQDCCYPIIIGFYDDVELARKAGEVYVKETHDRFSPNHTRTISYDVCEISLNTNTGRFCGWVLSDEEDSD